MGALLALLMGVFMPAETQSALVSVEEAAAEQPSPGFSGGATSTARPVTGPQLG